MHPGRQVHIGVLLENMPEYLFWTCAVALSGSVLVGINPTRRGRELAGDIRHTDCDLIITDDLIITEDSLAGLLVGIGHGVPAERVINIAPWVPGVAPPAPGRVAAGRPSGPGGDAAAVQLRVDQGTQGGDQMMCALRMADGIRFDPRAFAAFLDGQSDMGTKWQPRFIRLVGQVPVTATGKTTKTGLRREAWATSDRVYWEPAPRSGYRPFGRPERAALEKEFAGHGRTALLLG